MEISFPGILSESFEAAGFAFRFSIVGAEVTFISDAVRTRPSERRRTKGFTGAPRDFCARRSRNSPAVNMLLDICHVARRAEFEMENPFGVMWAWAGPGFGWK